MEKSLDSKKEEKVLDSLFDCVTQENFRPIFKRLMRQLDERAIKVRNRQKSSNYYQNKRKEFISLIDKVITQGWFKMPPRGTRIYKIYYDVWK